MALYVGVAVCQMGELGDNTGCTGGCTTQGHTVSASPNKAYVGSTSGGSCATQLCGCDWAGSHGGSQTDVYFLSTGGQTSSSSDANILKQGNGDASKCSDACGASVTCTCARLARRPSPIAHQSLAGHTHADHTHADAFFEFWNGKCVLFSFPANSEATQHNKPEGLCPRKNHWVGGSSGMGGIWFAKGVYAPAPPSSPPSPPTGLHLTAANAKIAFGPNAGA